MAERYEYHKQNDYPGERIAERKRVADRADAAEDRADARVAEKGRTDGLRADARVAEKGRTDELKADKRVATRGRMDDELMDSEIQRSTARAQDVNRSRNNADIIGLIVIASILVILLAGSAWGYVSMRQQSNDMANEIDYLNSQLVNSNARANAPDSCAPCTADTTPPIVLYLSPINSVSPVNNAMDVATTIQITAMLSEDMDPSTINKDTFVVMQRTTPESGVYRSLELDGTVTYSGRTATFISKERFYPNQIYGNVFTVTITTGAEDLAGNSLAHNYVWSFTTGVSPFNTGGTTSQTG